MVDTVRERIMAQLKRNLEAMTVDDHTVAWNTVTRSPLEQESKVVGNVVGVYDTAETFIYQTCYLQANLRVLVEFWYNLKRGDVPSVELNRLLGHIKKVILTDVHVQEDETDAQLAQNVSLISSDIDIDAYGARNIVSGMAEFDVTYRHRKDDPFILM